MVLSHMCYIVVVYVSVCIIIWCLFKHVVYNIYVYIAVYILSYIQTHTYAYIQLGKASGHFRANSKALAENEGDGIAKVS